MIARAAIAAIIIRAIAPSNIPLVLRILIGSIALPFARVLTYIVRGLLKKSGTVPMTDTDKVDVDEFNRGRLIGALERDGRILF